MFTAESTSHPRAATESAALPAVVRLHAPGRLHLGFLDPAGSLGRPFGSLGLVIDGFETVLELARSHDDAFTAATLAAQAELPRAQACVARLRLATACHSPVHLRLLQVLPPHSGFGSGTQLALAIGRAFAQLHGLEVPTPTLAAWLGRGKRSGIGIAGFDQGGLLLDGGPGTDGRAAPVLARLALPEAWRVLVVQDHAHQGLHGAQEAQAIGRLKPLRQAQAADLCHQVLMRVLAGAAADDFAGFAAGLNHVQQVLGAHFAPAQQGHAFTSPAVGQLLQWLAEAPQAAGGAAAVGQSSWGPTGFAIVPSLAVAEAAVQAAHKAGLLGPGLEVQIVRARQRGASSSIC